MMTAFLAMIAVGANARLFMKCSIPGWKAFVPGYNVVMAMKIIGRPASHALFFLIPGFNLFFFLRTTIELAQSFGKKSNLDFALAAVFNVFYVSEPEPCLPRRVRGAGLWKDDHVEF